ncbi:MAG: ABC transporter ATP-binding protein [Bifidobacteriaceae bacterium]|jgi:putative ABC transport system ATP-binding protein|nr:ABC transporter ATP-binding protein [Bifidobacteriaceae bacterium]
MPLITFQNVSKTYPTKPPVYALKSVSASINEGEFISIVGVSGSGKSTFLNILGLLDVPTSGSYLFDGKDTKDLNANEKTLLRGSKIGFVFQSFHLIASKTVTENVALSGMYTKVPRKVRFQNATDALKKVGLENRADFYPDTLSGGEKQRVAIARAISETPKLLLCDEPTGNLDSENSNEVIEILRHMNVTYGLTIIVVTHDNELATKTQRIIYMKDGEISV